MVRRGIAMRESWGISPVGPDAWQRPAPLLRVPSRPYFRAARRRPALVTGICVLLALLVAGGSLAGAEPSRKDPLAALEPRSKSGSAGPTDSVELPDGRARTSLFGLVGEGFKFVYVFDRSGSMGGSGRQAFQLVKHELRGSLQSLDTVHQFQLIFYNERPVIFNPSGIPGRLAFATEENKQRALRFLDSITPDGGTEHEAALKLAIRLRPDVIFFLTDGDDPQLTPQQIERLSRLAAGITIHTIEFGSGPRPAGSSFLAALAAENGGKYVYVDITAPERARGTER